MVSAPPPICPGTLAPERHMEPEPSQEFTTQAMVFQGQSTTSQTAQLPAQPIDKPQDMNAVSLLWDLEEAVKQIPSDTPSMTPEHQLSTFSIDLHACVAEPGEDDWLILNQMMKSSFGWGEREMAAIVPHLLNQGPYGLDGFIHFLRFFVQERGLWGALFETKIDAIGSYPSKASTSTQTATIMEAPTCIQNMTKNQDVIDVDKIEDVVREVEPRVEHKGKQKVSTCRATHNIHKPAKGWPCKGILVTFPERTTHHQSYPFGMHSKHPMPWNYRSTNNVFYLQAKLCKKKSFTEGRSCFGNCNSWAEPELSRLSWPSLIARLSRAFNTLLT
ncbi:hypothetical protein EDB83DRAFT_2313286 [Lactarius deliciosus]|nr:hypothetical protein EDB83DRAFT_2313286 [Lactarius deliciosus]